MSVEVGFGKGIITPDLPVVLAGFGARKGPVHEVRHELEARAVVVRDGDVTLCLLVLDLLMLAADHADPVRSAVATALGITPGQVLTSSTHTHAGPSAARSARRAGWPAPEGYVEILVAGCVDAAREAHHRLAPATFSYGHGRLPDGISTNRRGLPYDPRLAVLEVLDGDGARMGTIANVAIHPVALGVTCRAVSGDWVTTYRDTTERATGVPCVLLPGALGDVNPARDPHTHPDPAGNWDTAAAVGVDVRDAVLDLLTRVQPVGDRASVIARREVHLRAAPTVASLLSGTALRRVDVELFEWSLGGVRLVSLPGEGFHALGRAIERSRGEQVLLAGLAPVWQGYLPAPFRLGYEESMSFGRRFVAPLRELLVTPPQVGD